MNFNLHTAGWLEGGLAIGYEKFMLDEDQASMAGAYLGGVDLSENGLALQAMLDGGPGQHFLGSPHTLANFENAFWRSELSDNNSFEQWELNGGHDAAQRANAAWKRRLAEYEEPRLDEAVHEELRGLDGPAKGELPRLRRLGGPRCGRGQKLILDVDTGTDDAVALMLAALHPDLELVAATTVNGNNPVDACTDNTLRVFDLLGLSIPVYEGAATPLVRDDFPVPREILHKRGSMHPLELPIPAPRSVKQAQRAVEFLVETYLAATDPIALVPVGPLTNIAMAIRLEPRIVERIPQTIIMGGAHESGNTTPSAEFNIWVDPDAARVVFGAGLQNLTLMPLDATHRALVSRADCRRLRDLGHPGRGRRRGLHRGADRRLRCPPADGHGRQRAGPRRAVHRLPGRPDAWSVAAGSTSTSRRAASSRSGGR